jgi:polysaccharide export outer membrane protein
VGALYESYVSSQNQWRAMPLGPLNRSIEAGDRLDVMVMEDSTLSGQFPVRESGDIVLPKVGRVHVAGMSVSAAESAVRSRIQRDQIKDATVVVERSGRVAQASFAERPKMLVFLSGAVMRPGQHLVAMNDRNGLTAYEALLIAGGATSYGDTRRGYILRKVGGVDRERIPVDFRALSRGEAQDLPIVQGDVIFVPERRFGL